MIEFAHLLDPGAAAIVVGGTLTATVLRCGMADVRVTLASLAALRRGRFDPERARADLAHQVNEIREDGVVRAEGTRLGDREIDEATNAFIGGRSLTALHEAHEAHREQRAVRMNRAVGTLAQAAELSPVFGLAGTLVSLTQLQVSSASGDFSAAISMAVLTTLYGLLLGNVICAPLARLVERAGLAEERARGEIIAWLETQVAAALPRLRS